MEHQGDEARIIQAVLCGQVDEFEKLVLLYQERIFRIVGKSVDRGQVEEVAHEVFVKAFEDLSAYRGDAPFEHWISKIAVRTCYDYWRSRRRRERRSVPLPEGGAFDGSIEEQQERSERTRLKEWVNAALSKLDAQERLLFNMFYVEELPHQEIGRIMGWSISAVKSRAFRLRRRLKDILARELS